MSIIFFIAMFVMARDGIVGVGMDFFIAWALFSIADAAWFGRFKNDR